MITSTSNLRQYDNTNELCRLGGGGGWRFYLHVSTLILARISNNMPSKVWDEITYLFPKSILF